MELLHFITVITQGLPLLLAIFLLAKLLLGRSACRHFGDVDESDIYLFALSFAWFGLDDEKQTLVNFCFPLGLFSSPCL